MDLVEKPGVRGAGNSLISLEQLTDRGVRRIWRHPGNETVHVREATRLLQANIRLGDQQEQ